jgi:site-specific DNA-cytosine methylase
LLIVSFPAWFSRQPTYFNDVADPLTVKAGPPAVMIGRQRIFGLEDSPAKTSQSQESGKALKMEKDQSSPSHSSTLWSDTDLGGSCWKTYLGSSRQMMDETSPDFSVKWMNSGMAYRGELWMHATSESPKDAVEYSLSQVLEPTSPDRFYLSAKAAVGILRRAERRGRKLPPALDSALKSLALSSPDTAKELTAPLSQDNSSSEETTQSQVQQEPLTVRRLTPVECERLMGWGDGWTIPAPEHWVQRSRAKKTSE